METAYRMYETREKFGKCLEIYAIPSPGNSFPPLSYSLVFFVSKNYLAILIISGEESKIHTV